jgi:hypothetical protein
MPRINTTVGKNLIGIGDMVSLAWIAEGTRESPDSISFYASGGNLRVLKLLCQDVAEHSDGERSIEVGKAYEQELEEGGLRLRLDYIRELLNLDTPYLRPRVKLAPDDLAWARDIKQQSEADDLVLLFPQTLWESRAWPASYWVDLAWQLKARNAAPLVVLANEDKRFTNTPRFIWGFDINKVAALMSLSALVIGNDSGPAHLSGTIGVTTIVACGPTRGSCVFGHIPEVISLVNDDSPFCAGCHFKAPFRAACDQGCQALFALKPHRVLNRAVSELALYSLRRDRPPAGLAPLA